MCQVMKSKFEYVDPVYMEGEYPESVPRRMTKDSAGYDFFLPSGLILTPGQSVELKSNIKCYLHNDQQLELRLRSSVARRGVVLLMDTVDADYVDNKINGGNITLMLYLLPGFKPLKFERGDRLVQGLVQKYDKLDEEYCDGKVRISGLGSTKA